MLTTLTTVLHANGPGWGRVVAPHPVENSALAQAWLAHRAGPASLTHPEGVSAQQHPLLLIRHGRGS